MKVGDIRHFNHPQKGKWILKEIISSPKMDLDWDWEICECPHCKKVVTKKQTYTLEKLFIWENEAGKILTTCETTPVTKDGKGLTMRVPDKEFYADKDMSLKIRKKSKYLKEKL